jgi:hypothetical protein
MPAQPVQNLGLVLGEVLKQAERDPPRHAVARAARPSRIAPPNRPSACREGQGWKRRPRDLSVSPSLLEAVGRDGG